jgi:hypothetical protein
MNSHAETISLVTLLTLVLAAGLLIGGVAFVSDLGSKDLDNEAVVISSQERVQSLLTSYSETPEQSVEETFILGAKNIILFFSSGESPIYLAHRFPEGQGQLQDDKVINKEHYLKFERPELAACQGSACICHCQEPLGLWQEIREEPYVQATRLRVIEDKLDTGYSCANAVCREIVSSDPLYFSNGRGSTEYANQVATAVQTMNDEDIFSPIMMDAVLLMQNKARNDGNIFFSSAPGDDYNRFEQDTQYVEELTQNYYWDGGVALGGSGFAQSSSDENDRILRSIPVTLRLQTYPNTPNIVGVCTSATCLFENERVAALQNYQQFVTAQAVQKELPQRFGAYYVYLQLQVEQQLIDGTFDVEEFVTETHNFLTYFEQQGLDAELIFTPVGNQLEVQARVAETTTEAELLNMKKFHSSDITSHNTIIRFQPFTLDANNPAASIIPARVSALESANLITYRSYAVSYNAVADAIELTIQS